VANSFPRRRIRQHALLHGRRYRRLRAEEPIRARRQRLAATYHSPSGIAEVVPTERPSLFESNRAFSVEVGCAAKPLGVSRLRNPSLSQVGLGCAALNEPRHSSSERRRAATAALLIQGFGQRMWTNDQRTAVWRTAAEPE
jgi:hypothetical protein